MNQQHIQNAAALAGLSKVLGSDESNFILFDTDTDGRVGRRIYIHKDLSNHFLNFKDEGELIHAFQQIKQLRAIAGGITSSTNANSAEEHKTVISGRAEITYKIIQVSHSAERLPGVYITNLELASFDKHEAGLYKVKPTEQFDQYITKKSHSESVTSNLAAINGLTRNLDQAASDIIPPMLESAFPVEFSNLNSAGYDLFYNPQYLYKHGKKWRTPSQKLTTKAVTVSRLKEAFESTQNQNNKVNWVIHGNGITLLREALQKANGKNLSNNNIIFMAPTEDLSRTLPLLKKCNISLHKKVMQIHPHDWTSKRAQLKNPALVKEQLGHWGYEDRGEILWSDRRDDLASIAKTGLKMPAKIGLLSTGAFLAAPTGFGALIAMTVGGIVGGYDALKSSQKIRNMASNSISDTSYSPHLNPHKGVKELNLAAKNASGSLIKTFWDVVKLRVKG